MKYLCLILIGILFFRCQHPESPNYKRHKDVSEQLNAFKEAHDKSDINATKTNIPHYRRRETPFSSSDIIKMVKINGVYQVPVSINGIPMKFILDTGAGAISFSALEATFLYKQGKLDRDDFIGSSKFVDANGNISEGVLINLKTVTIGNKTLHNVRASIVNNLKAPLLLGQTALSRFGTVTIDYNNEVLILQ